MQEENDTLRDLYERALMREYSILDLEKKRAPPCLTIIQQEHLQESEALIAAHPSKPKTLEEEVSIKLDIINFNIFHQKKVDGLCDDCANYLDNRIINEEPDSDRAQERIKAIQPNDIVCTKITPGLRSSEPMPAICPYYQQDEILAGGSRYKDVIIWEKLKKKYVSMLPQSQNGPRKRF